MVKKPEQSYQELVDKYKQRIRNELGASVTAAPALVSREYKQFKEFFYPKQYTWYEKLCQISGGVLRLGVSGKEAEELEKNIAVSHLNVTPSGTVSFAVLGPLVLAILGSLIAFAVFQKPMLVVFFLLVGVALYFIFRRLPYFIANTWRMKASNQMVLGIFYLVTYMRHTSNLERAIEFASEHLTPPLSIDFRKIIWDLETQKSPTVKEAAENYLNGWREFNPEFVEAFHLVESSLYEGSEERRLNLLDKALDVILTGTYEKMMHYARELQSPMTVLHMLGIILPILGLVILPLVVSFMASDDTSAGDLAFYIALLYNVTLPLGVFYLGKMILSRRPTGYGDSDITEENPSLKKYQNIIIPLGKVEIAVNPLFLSLGIGLVLAMIGLSPLILHALDPAYEVAFDDEGKFALMGYVCPPHSPDCAPEEKVGPYGIGASLLSLVLVLGISLPVGLYFRLRSQNVLQIRERTKQLEDEFSSALFQLGNRLGDGLPAEIAFARVAENMPETASGEFFRLVERNITQLGMDVREAIFDRKVGALTFFPSKVIESSMKVLVESLKRGPRAAALAMTSMARYIKEIHKVNERLKDLMAEIISSMKSQIVFLTPAIAGIVVGITSMVTTILTNLTQQLTTFAQQGQGVGGFGDMLDLFGIGIPTYYFQLIIGIYIIELTYILTILVSGVENGVDRLQERFLLGKYLTNSPLLYCVISGVVIIAFSIFVTQIISRTLTS